MSSSRDKLDRHGEHRGSGRANEDRLGWEKNAARDSEPTQNGAREGGDRIVPTTSVVNPLNRYLGDWMTPQDYSLLKPGLAQSAMNGLNHEGSREGGLVIPGSNALRPGAVDQPGLRSSNVTNDVPAAKPKENPFLQALNAPAVPVNPPSSFVTPAQVVTVSPPKISMMAAPPAPVSEPAKSKVPDFAKPVQDEKYFKQLKRF
jgi:hypothetical protein